jgi:hypothetical protein
VNNKEIRKTTSFKIEPSLMAQFKKILNSDNEENNIGLTPGSWIRKQIIIYIRKNQGKV